MPPTKSSAANGQSSESYTEFKLRSCSADEVKDLRHHVLKFHSRAKVDPQSFQQPVRFHRKDPRNLQYQLTISEQEQRKQAQEDAVAAAAAAAANPTAKPQADMSIVAPDGGARRFNKPFQKKTRQVQGGDEATKKLRYEEYYPWVMEDFEGENTWVGNYEAAQSDAYVLFVFDVDGFKMVPAEKFYKMTPRNKFATLTLEEAEERMEKKNTAPRWIMKHIEREREESAASANMRRRPRFKTVDGLGEGSRRDNDGDEIDFDEEFADDEEAPIMEGNDDELKEVEEKIKKEQRTASALVPREDRGEEDNDEDERKIDKEGRKLRKYLRSLEKNHIYESDDEENPYASEPDEEEDEDVDDIFNEPEEKDTKLPKIKQEVKTEPVMLNLRKPLRKNLPPGTVVLQLAPQVLARFPRDVWNPNAKRPEMPHDTKRRRDSATEGISKKVKLEKSPTPVPSRKSSPLPPGDSNDPSLLTEEDVRKVIQARPVSAKELLAELKPKLKKHPDNQDRLKALVRKVAKLQDGVLVLRDA
ncbi:transcription initiation factor IIF subunit alpha [Trichomonascus vanleenenianus]|uniref:transcription factor IIF subunit TFG1 n=1 Tax=Trichomonascus vanleenenianus TaxID=2268995 RepID=UPI003ECBA942